MSHFKALGVALVLTALFSPSPGNAQGRIFPSVLFLEDPTARGADSLDQQSLFTTVRLTGLQPRTTHAAGLFASGMADVSLLVIPSVSARPLTDKQTSDILAAVRSGMRLITDRWSPLSDSLGLALAATNVHRVDDRLRPEVQLRWPDTPAVMYIAHSPHTDASVIYDAGKDRPLSLLIHYGDGLILFFAPEFDGISGQGYARFPTAPYAIITALGLKPALTRSPVDAYFDPGYRYKETPEELVHLWKQRGIRAVHVAAWYAYHEPAFQFARLLKELHAHGMLAYAWLEWPYVGKAFWDRHPEWREKNARLQDARIDFLYLMDLQNPACLQTALHELEEFLREDWDGIDVAELSITGGVGQALEGAHAPEYFTGFSDISRQRFKKAYGFDPAELFETSSPHYWRSDTTGLQAFYQYRTSANIQIMRSALGRLDSLNRAGSRQWELMLTILDPTPHPEAAPLLAMDLDSTLSIVRAHRFTLQVEDLGSEWVKPPARYAAMGMTYRSLLGALPFTIDINVIPIHPVNQKGFASNQAVGTELALQWEAASRYAQRVCFYSEQSIFEHDWEMLPYTFASGAEAEGTGSVVMVDAPGATRLTLPPEMPAVLVDGRQWPAAGPGYILLPRGTHHLAAASQEASPDSSMRLLEISDELIDCERRGDTLFVEYDSPARCALTLSFHPRLVLEHGTVAAARIYTANERPVVLGPKGRHRLGILR